MKKNILIVDDHPIVSTGLRTIIEHTGDYGKIHVANDMAASLQLLRQKPSTLPSLTLSCTTPTALTSSNTFTRTIRT